MTHSSKTQSETDSADPAGPAGEAHQPEKPRRATLRPPDWTAPNSVSSLALERLVQSKAIPRRAGSRAELASTRARIKEARRIADVETERNLSMSLARKLVSRGTRLAEATKLARRSLLLGEDPELREELSNWFAGLGEVGLAAGTLEPLLDRADTDGARASVWSRIAVLRGRAGDAVGSAKAFWSAAEADRGDPVPLELFAALRRHIGSSLPAHRAARALHDAAQRRKARGDEKSAFADLLQAFEADPGYIPATEQLSDALFRSGRFQAADEVWRIAAEHKPDPKPLHRRRLQDALGSSDVALALGAALDAADDTQLDFDGIRTAVRLVNDGAGTVPVPNFDGLLAPSGLLHWLAARLEVAALVRGDHRALLALARLTAGPLGNARQAAGYLIDALALKPDSQEALSALQQYALSTGDYAAVIDANIRVALRDDVEPSVLKERLSELALTAAGHLGEVHCAAWAVLRLRELGSVPAELVELEQRISNRDSKTPRFEPWSQLSLAELRRALDALADRPTAAEAYIEALFEMQKRDPSGERWREALERAFKRQESFDRLEQFWRTELEQRRNQAAARLGLCRLFLAQHRPQDALELLRNAAGESLDVESAALLSVVGALYGTVEDRALGLEKLADHARAPVRATLLSVASALLLASGGQKKALRLAEEACHALPSATRPIVSYAQAAHGERSRVAALSFQRASEVTVPRVEWCRALADGHDEPRQLELALRRWLSLTPLDIEASRRLLSHLASTEDAEQLAKTLDWLLGQPVPLVELSDELGRAMRVIVNKNPLAAKALAQRMLGVFGAKTEPLNQLISEISEQLGEPWLRLVLLERGLATLRGEAHVGYLELARVRQELGHADLVYDAALSALTAGADREEVRQWLPSVGEPTTSDGVLSQLGCWAIVTEQHDAEDAAHAYREYGAALWDLAGDVQGAVAAWERAAELDEERGDERLARDLLAFCGYQAALPELFALAKKHPKKRSASLLIAAAALALADGFREEAAQLSIEGLSLDPTRTDALAIVERSLPRESSEQLEQAYQQVEDSVLGVYGSRAVHYRAARQFERRREHLRAFRHAMLAFEAVPAEGVAFALMLRLAPLAEQQGEAARAIERVAQAALDPASRAAWLERAARAAGPGPEGTRLRVDVLMRALLVRPEAESLEALGIALAELFGQAPEERLKLQSLFDSSMRTLLRRLDDPEMVDVAVAAAHVAADVFDSAGLTAGALRRALQLDPESKFFAGCERFLAVLVRRPGSTRPFLDELVEACTKGPLPAREILELGVALAEKVATDLVPDFVVAAARKSPDDARVIARAERTAREHPQLLDALRGIVDLSDRVSGLVERARALEVSDPETAVQLLQEVIQQRDVEKDVFLGAMTQLERLLSERRQFERLEKTLTSVLENERLDNELRMDAARRVAILLANRSAHTAALDVFLMIDRIGGMSTSDLEQAAQLARDGGDAKRELELRERLVAAPRGEAEPLVHLRRLQELSAELGQTQKAVGWAQQILDKVPGDHKATDTLLKDAERKQDWKRYVELARARLVLDKSPEERDVLQLADVIRLKQKRPRAAAEMLEAMPSLAQSATALERLAECWIEAGDLTKAAEVFARARRAVKEPRAVARYVELSVKNFLAAGELERAGEVLAAESLYPRTPALAELQVQVYQKQGDHKAQATALEELAAASMDAPSVRAEYLRTAAELALEDGDPDLALKRAQRAARIAPSDARAQVFARLLEYKARGAGSPQEALATITELRSLGPVRDARVAELRAFLLAEALGTRSGAEAAIKELREAERAHPESAIIALGLAEHLEPHGAKEEVLAYYKQALDDAVSVVRSLVDVVLAAAEYAEAHAAVGTALELLEPYAQRSDRIRQMIERLRATPGARTRFDLPQARPDRRPEFFASVPPSAEPLIESPVQSLKAQLSSKPAPVRSLSGSLSVKAPPRKPEQPPKARVSAFAPTPALGVPRVRPEHSSGAQSPTPPDGLSAQRTPPPKPEPTVRGGNESSPYARTIPASERSKSKTKPSLPVAALQQPTPRSATGGSGEFRAAKPIRLDQTVELPSMEVPKERPVEVAVKPDKRTLGQTLTSLDAEEVRAALEARFTPEVAPETEEAPPPSSEPPETTRDLPPIASRDGDVSPSSLQSGAWMSASRPSLSFSASSGSEQDLLQALRAGDIEAGNELARNFEGKPERTHDLIGILRMLVALRPGDVGLLARLAKAAASDRDLAYAGALRHALLSVSNPETAPAAPSLAHQTEQPQVLARMLSGDPLPPSLEALSLLLKNVPQLFRQHTSLEGSEIVAPSGLSPLSQLVEASHRLLSTQMTRVVLRSSQQVATFQVILSEPITLLIEGYGNPATAEYRFGFGAALYGSRPELALALSLSKERLQTVFEAVLAAFGPPRQLSGDVARVAQLAERLWESLPARAQRRLQELCEAGNLIRADIALGEARIASLKAGLFTSGDLGVASRHVCGLLGVDPLVLSHPDQLASLCAQRSMLAELFRFATSLEYAALRWTEPRSRSSIQG